MPPEGVQADYVAVLPLPATMFPTCFTTFAATTNAPAMQGFLFLFQLLAEHAKRVYIEQLFTAEEIETTNADLVYGAWRFVFPLTTVDHNEFVANIATTCERNKELAQARTKRRKTTSSDAAPPHELDPRNIVDKNLLLRYLGLFNETLSPTRGLQCFPVETDFQTLITENPMSITALISSRSTLKMRRLGKWIPMHDDIYNFDRYMAGAVFKPPSTRGPPVHSKLYARDWYFEGREVETFLTPPGCGMPMSPALLLRSPKAEWSSLELRDTLSEYFTPEEMQAVDDPRVLVDGYPCAHPPDRRVHDPLVWTPRRPEPQSHPLGDGHAADEREIYEVQAEAYGIILSTRKSLSEQNKTTTCTDMIKKNREELIRIYESLLPIITDPNAVGVPASFPGLHRDAQTLQTELDRNPRIREKVNRLLAKPINEHKSLHYHIVTHENTLWKTRGVLGFGLVVVQLLQCISASICFPNDKHKPKLLVGGKPDNSKSFVRQCAPSSPVAPPALTLFGSGNGRMV